MPDSVQGPARDVYDAANTIRGHIKAIAAETLRQKKLAMVLPASREGQWPDSKSETVANLTLAYRHLEDASMRLGKALQALDGGVSVYDASTTVGAPGAVQREGA